MSFLPSAVIYESFFFFMMEQFVSSCQQATGYSIQVLFWHSAALANESRSHLISHEGIFLW